MQGDLEALKPMVSPAVLEAFRRGRNACCLSACHRAFTAQSLAMHGSSIACNC